MTSIYLPPEQRVALGSFLLIVISAAALRWLNRQIDAALTWGAAA